MIVEIAAPTFDEAAALVQANHREIRPRIEDLEIGRCLIDTCKGEEPSWRGVLGRWKTVLEGGIGAMLAMEEHVWALMSVPAPQIKMRSMCESHERAGFFLIHFAATYVLACLVERSPVDDPPGSPVRQVAAHLADVGCRLAARPGNFLDPQTDQRLAALACELARSLAMKHRLP